MDVWLSEKQMRRPDVAYYTNEQIRRMNAGEEVVPEFMVALGSETDNELKSLTKRHEYFAAGVQVVWWVFPAFEEVSDYTSPKTVTIATDTDMLSAAPVLPDFKMTVAALFGK